MPLLKLVPAGSPQPPETMPPTRRRRGKKEPPHLQYDEFERLFRVIELPRDRAIFRVAYHAGLRASELGLLELRHYNPKSERISIHRLKGSHSGDHHLCREESRVLHAWLKVRGALPGLLFPSNRRLPIDRTTLDKMIKRYGAMAGLPENLRHFHILTDLPPGIRLRD